jgi:hypothetical protein
MDRIFAGLQQLALFVCGAMMVFIAGCATPPLTPQQVAAADYGTTVTQTDAEAAAKTWLSSYLKDPYSAVEVWQPVTQGYATTSIMEGQQRYFGYLLDGTVNAKNAYGGYVGARAFQFLIRNGQVVHVSAADPDTGVMMTVH